MYSDLSTHGLQKLLISIFWTIYLIIKKKDDTNPSVAEGFYLLCLTEMTSLFQFRLIFTKFCKFYNLN